MEEPGFGIPRPFDFAAQRRASVFQFSPVTGAILAGALVTFLQLVLALWLLAPEGPFSFRYQSLFQHDSFWFGNIVNRGYETIVPPISHKMMEVSNTAFFPAYPALAALLHYTFNIETENALLLTAQAAALGFWIYFFLFCARWQIPANWQAIGALLIAAHPVAFFLIAAYSESLFLMALVGFLYWSAEESWRGRILAALHGILMSATRIVGLPCALAPLVKRAWETGTRQPRSWAKNFGSPFLVSALAMLGGVAFFAYCQARWGHWNIYMLTQQLGWGIEPDYLAVFKLGNYHWLIPALDNPTEASQMAMTLGGLVLIVAIAAEFFAPRQSNRAVRLPFYFVAAVLYFLSVSGVACVDMESMLRYQFCMHPLIVLALLHYFANVPVRSRLARAGAMTFIVLISAFGLALESWYIWNFTRGNWVA